MWWILIPGFVRYELSNYLHTYAQNITRRDLHQLVAPKGSKVFAYKLQPVSGHGAGAPLLYLMVDYAALGAGMCICATGVG